MTNTLIDNTEGFKLADTIQEDIDVIEGRK